MTEEKRLCKHVNECNICASTALEEVISLPKFPFTGIFCSADSKLHDFVYEGIDQGLMLCAQCGHAQLKSVISPDLVYDNTYTHRGSASPIATQGNEFLTRFISSLFPRQTFRRIVDIGCNDGFLLRCLEDKGEKLVGIDPIWVGKDHQLSSKISILGGFIEEINLRSILDEDPCLVVSAHTFEHIAEPRRIFEAILSQARPGTVFVIEVPSFDTLIRNHRFDQVFHQHIQYFSQCSFLRLIEELKCTYISHTFNYSMWGGTMLFAFKNTPSAIQPVKFTPITQDQVLKSYKRFQRSLVELATVIGSMDEPCYGFGAAQMVPSLVYHIPDRLTKVKQIVDDNAAKQGLKYPRLHFNIISSGEVHLEDANVVITALDSARPILERLIRLKTKRIFIPMQVL